MGKFQGLLNSFYLCSKSDDFLAVFALAHSKINQIAKKNYEVIGKVSD